MIPSLPAAAQCGGQFCERFETDYDARIDVAVDGLSMGPAAAISVIIPGQVSTILLVSAEEGASLKTAVPLQVVGRAQLARGRPPARPTPNLS